VYRQGRGVMLKARRVAGKRERGEAPGLRQIYTRRRCELDRLDGSLVASACVLVTEVDSQEELVRLEPLDPVSLGRERGGRHRTASWRTLRRRYTRAAGLEQQRDKGQVLAGEIERRGGGELGVAGAVAPAAPPIFVTGGIGQLVDSVLLSEIRQVRGILADVRDLVKMLVPGPEL